MAPDGARLDHVDRVAVAVVVVADVLLVELRCAGGFVGSAEVLPVPIDNHVLPIGIDGKPQNQDDVVEDGGNLGVVVAG